MCLEYEKCLVSVSSENVVYQVLVVFSYIETNTRQYTIKLGYTYNNKRTPTATCVMFYIQNRKIDSKSIFNATDGLSKIKGNICLFIYMVIWKRVIP